MLKYYIEEMALNLDLKNGEASCYIIASLILMENDSCT
jgi:hypothetical protein